MFLIGIFGTNAKAEPAGQLIVPCRCCQSTTPLQLSRRYQYFHAFFLPIFRYDSHYFVTCPGCASVYEVASSVGERAHREGSATASPEDLQLLQNNSRRCCPTCRAPIAADDQFCRRCGARL